MLLPNRHANTPDYRYGFNGKEMDKEVKGEGLQIDYGFRIYDPRLGKFLSLDPLLKEYPWYTPYQFAGNTPIQAIDLDGLEELHYNLIIDKQTNTAVLKYSHSTDIVDKVVVMDRMPNTNGSAWRDPGEYHYEEKVNQRTFNTIHIFDASYGNGRENRTETSGEKARNFVEKYKGTSDVSRTGEGYAEAYSFDQYDFRALSTGRDEISNDEKDQMDFDSAMTLLSFAPISRLFSYTSKYVKVGRWMSKSELDKMRMASKLQPGSGEQTRIILNGDKYSYLGAKSGEVYVEFKIPSSTHIGQGGKTNWGIIFDESSVIGKYLKGKGIKIEMPSVKDIKVIEHKK